MNTAAEIGRAIQRATWWTIFSAVLMAQAVGQLFQIIGEAVSLVLKGQM